MYSLSVYLSVFLFLFRLVCSNNNRCVANFIVRTNLQILSFAISRNFAKSHGNDVLLILSRHDIISDGPTGDVETHRDKPYDSPGFLCAMRECGLDHSFVHYVLVAPLMKRLTELQRVAKSLDSASAAASISPHDSNVEGYYLTITSYPYKMYLCNCGHKR